MSDAGRERLTTQEISRELSVRQRRRRLLRAVAGTVGVLLTASAVVVLLATFFFPTLRIYGTSMEPALREGQVAVSVRSDTYRRGDVVAFYYNNKILVKRVICGPGELFNMQEDGTVYVNGERLDEPYVRDPGFGTCDLTLPYQVPEGQYFLMGDQRATSVDSRMEQIGAVPLDRIVGRVALRVWPLGDFGTV